MRRTLSWLLVACCGSCATDVPFVPFPAHDRLLEGDDSLAAMPMIATAAGAWQNRRTSAHAPERAGRAPGAGRSSAGLSAGLSAGPSAPSTPGPGGPATGGPAGPTTGTPPAGARTGGRGITLIDTPLRAGATDDNVEFDDYLKFLADSREVERLRGRFVDLDVSGRRTIRALDALGRPVPGAAVAVFSTATKRQIWRGTTYGDGRTPFYPKVAVTDDTIGGWMVEVQAAGRAVRKPWRGDADLELVVPVDAAKPLLQVDVAFVIDTTGSMGDEIKSIQDTLLEVTRRLRALGTEFELRYGAVLYRDVGDIYLTSQHAFTADIEAFDQALREVRADAGGDGPESMNQGLAVAVDRLEWREGAAKLAFLIADAPPHLDYADDVPYDRSLRAAVARGIKIHSVAASGLDAAGSVVLRQIAQFTRGQFVFIEYGRNLKKTAEGHGVAKPGAANNLDEILFARVQAEIANWGR